MRLQCISVLLLLLLIALLSVECTRPKEDGAFWKDYGQNRLKETLNIRHRNHPAKNIIVFIGDGMGMATITAGRIYKGQHQPVRSSGEETVLSWEQFPFVGLSKTYNVDKQVPDSAATATAIFTGAKVKYQTLGLDAQAKHNVCDVELNNRSRLTSMMLWAQEADKATGLVTTTRITHATPAATYARSNHRDWECDGEVPLEYRECTVDIARQLAEQQPGKSFKVILGGGQKQMGVFQGNVSVDDSCSRQDSRNLVNEWMKDKPNASYVTNKEQLMDADFTNVSDLIGLFSPGHIPYGYERTHQHPSLVNMTIQAIRLLSRDPNGFVLMVEGGRIDHAHHDNYAQLALAELSELDDAVATALRYVDLDETLVIVTADHSHAVTLNGYPDRGNDILGVVDNDGQQYETLTYANGPAYDEHWDHDHFRNLSTMNRTDPKYRHFAPIPLDSETHGGEDVPVYATGPWAHLLSGVFEQNYIAHVVGYAGCIGDGLTSCDEHSQNIQEASASASTSASASSTISTAITTPLLILLIFLHRLL